MKLILALIVGLFIGYYAHDLRDKKTDLPIDSAELPASVSFDESKQLQSDYIDNSPENAAVYINLSKENLAYINALNAHFRYPKGFNMYLARQNGENDRILLVPYGMKSSEEEDGSEDGEERVYIIEQREPICPPTCDLNSPYKFR